MLLMCVDLSRSPLLATNYFSFLRYAFEKLHYAILVTMVLGLISTACVFILCVTRNTAWYAVYMLSQATILAAPLYLVAYLQLNLGSASIVILHAIALCMKLHAFESTKHEGSAPNCLSNFIKFAWYPTLVYEQNVKCIDTNILRAIRELFVAVCCFSIVHWLHVWIVFPALAQPFSIWLYVLHVPVIVLCFELMKYAFWHCCMSFLADVTGYPHRNFYYSDTTESVTKFFQKWSAPVHRWLHTYPHKQSQRVFGFGKTKAMLLACAVSAFFHEYAVMGVHQRVTMPYSSCILLGVVLLLALEHAGVLGFNPKLNSPRVRLIQLIIVLTCKPIYYFAVAYA